MNHKLIFYSLTVFLLSLKNDVSAVTFCNSLE
jgi:hypothetical protein